VHIDELKALALEACAALEDSLGDGNEDNNPVLDALIKVDQHWRNANVEMRRLVEALVDNHPLDYAADAVTVYDVWIKEARAALERTKQ